MTSVPAQIPGGVPVTVTTQPTQIPMPGGRAVTIINTGNNTVYLTPTPDIGTNDFPISSQGGVQWPQGPCYAYVANTTGTLYVIQGGVNYYNPAVNISGGTLNVTGNVDATITNASLPVTGNVGINGTANVNVQNASLSVTGSTVTIGSIPAITFASGQSVDINAGTVDVQNVSGNTLAVANPIESVTTFNLVPQLSYQWQTITVTQPVSMWQLSTVPVLVPTHTTGVTAFQVANVTKGIISQFLTPANSSIPMYFVVPADIGDQVTFQCNSVVNWVGASLNFHVVGTMGLQLTQFYRPDGRLLPQSSNTVSSRASGTLIPAPTTGFSILLNSLYVEPASSYPITATRGGNTIYLFDTNNTVGRDIVWPNGLLLDPNTGVSVGASGSYVTADYDIVY